MSNEELLKMAEEAGFGKVPEVGGLLIKFAALVQIATAEDCAKVCEAQKQRLSAQLHHHAVVGAEECADAIRRAARTKYQLK